MDEESVYDLCFYGLLQPLLRIRARFQAKSSYCTNCDYGYIALIPEEENSSRNLQEKYFWIHWHWQYDFIPRNYDLPKGRTLCSQEHPYFEGTLEGLILLEQLRDKSNIFGIRQCLLIYSVRKFTSSSRLVTIHHQSFGKSTPKQPCKLSAENKWSPHKLTSSKINFVFSIKYCLMCS